MNRTSKSIILIVTGLWGGLGAYRGAQDYNKNYNIDYKQYLINPNYYKKPQYYYTLSIGYSMISFISYVNPITLPIFFYLELYNLEKQIICINDKEE
jgi:hypothetical protein